MSRQSRLQQLLSNPGIWKHGRNPLAGHQILPTGFRELDEYLNGGWPLGVLTEVLFEQKGAGELSMLMPALAQLSQQGLPQTTRVESGACWIAWVTPPYTPYPPALAQHGIDVTRLLMAHPDGHQDVLWTIEQILRSGTCGAVLAWLAKADGRATRRLQLAAEKGRCLAVIFRPVRFGKQPSSAPLRIQLSPGSTGPQLNLLRNRYGPTGSFNLPC